jgi:hypothetical protein
MSNYPEWDSCAVNPDLYIEKYTDYTKDPVLKNILDGKRVAIVGPSSHLIGENLGDYIDSFDVVVRVGFLEEPSEKTAKDYGGRTDIIIHSFNCFEIPVAKDNIDYLCGTKFVICGMVSNDFIDEHELFFDLLRSRSCNIQNVDDSFLYGFFRSVGTICNLGLIGIELILKYQIESLYVTGMSFYNMGKYGRVYGDSYFEMVSDKMGIYKKTIDREVTPESARSDLHVQKPQIDYFRNLVKKDNRIILDEYLDKNLFVS